MRRTADGSAFACETTSTFQPAATRPRQRSLILVLVRSMTAQGVIDVTVSGAVRTSGQHRLGEPATVGAALDAAGGFASATPQMSAADTVTVRRPQGDGKVDVFRFSLSETPR